MEEFDNREFLISFLSNFKFVERYRIEVSQNDDDEIQKHIIDKGVFKHEHRYYGVIDANYAYKIERLVEEKLDDLKKVEKIYYGEKYILVLSEGKIYSFNKEYYNFLESIINELQNLNLFSSNPIYLIGSLKKSNGKSLIVKTDTAYFLLACINADFAEEERIILSSKLEQSQSFFEILAPKYYDWTKLRKNKDVNFEKIVELLLQKEIGITRVIPIGKTNAADRGRDFEVTEEVASFTERTKKKWLVQSKFSMHSISPATISGWIERVIEHNYEGFWLITNNDITPTLFDQFKDVKDNDKYSFEIRFWQRSDLHIKMNLYNEVFSKLDFFGEDIN